MNVHQLDVGGVTAFRGGWVVHDFADDEMGREVSGGGRAGLEFKWGAPVAPAADVILMADAGPVSAAGDQSAGGNDGGGRREDGIGLRSPKAGDFVPPRFARLESGNRRVVDFSNPPLHGGKSAALRRGERAAGKLELVERIGRWSGVGDGRRLGKRNGWGRGQGVWCDCSLSHLGQPTASIAAADDEFLHPLHHAFKVTAGQHAAIRLGQRSVGHVADRVGGFVIIPPGTGSARRSGIARIIIPSSAFDLGKAVSNLASEWNETR